MADNADDKPSKSQNIGVRVDNDVANKIDELVIHVRRGIREGRLPRRGKGRSVGPGTIASEIVQRVVRDYPGLLAEFFKLNEPVSPQAEESLPKDKSRPPAKRKKVA